MKTPISRLAAFARGKNMVHAVIETPKCSHIKYSYEPKIGLFRVKRALPEGMMFPFNFGFIPNTLADDGDPLDILILNEEPLMPGCYVVAHLLGVIKATQTEDGETVRNDRLVGAAIAQQTPSEFETIEFNRKNQNEIQRFFITYNQIDGKKFKIIGRAGPKRAREMVHEGIKRAEKES